MTDNMLNFVLANLPKTRTELEAIEKDVGVPASTMEKIARGYTRNPRFETIQTLHDYFKSTVQAA